MPNQPFHWSVRLAAAVSWMVLLLSISGKA